MRSSRNYSSMQIKAGAVLAGALLLLFLALIVFPTRGVNPFSPKISLFACYSNVAGLRASSPVWLSGVEVGTVSEVRPVPGSDPLRVRVKMQVQRWTLGHLRTDSKAVIKGMGLLGDMFIELTPGTGGARITDGSVLAGVMPGQTQEELGQTIAVADTFLRTLNRITDQIAAGEGTLGRLIADPDLYRQMVAATAGANALLGSLNSPEGSAGRFLREPALYEATLASVQDIQGLVADLRKTEEKLLSPQTREALSKTVATASRLVDRAGEIEEKISKIRFDFHFGVEKLESDLVLGHADLGIWPTVDRYYQAGVRQSNRLYGNEEEETTFRGELAWRIAQTPLFIRGGVIRNEFFLLGLDGRSRDNDFRVLLDAYRLQFSPLQLDLRAGYRFLDLIELSVGAEDLLRRPFFKAGVSIFYSDPDLLNILIRTFF